MTGDREILPLSPRLVRLRDAPGYLGMDRSRFNHEVKPYLATIPIGQQGATFDRLDSPWVRATRTRTAQPGATDFRNSTTHPLRRAIVFNDQRSRQHDRVKGPSWC
jgi:hypothetical protein